MINNAFNAWSNDDNMQSIWRFHVCLKWEMNILYDIKFNQRVTDFQYQSEFHFRTCL